MARSDGGKRRPKKGGGQERADLIAAIAHPARRRVLRALLDGGVPSSPARLAVALELPVGSVGYHVRVLREFGAVSLDSEEMVRGAVEHFYVATIEDDPPVEALLEETRAFDEGDE